MHNTRNPLKIIFLFALVITTHFTMAQELTCKDFHTGKFKLVDPTSDAYSIVHRKKNKQTELIPQDDAVIKSKINWTSECVFELTILQSKNSSVTPSNFKHIILEVTIDSIHGNEASITTRIVTDGKSKMEELNGVEIKGKMIKLAD